MRKQSISLGPDRPPHFHHTLVALKHLPLHFSNQSIHSVPSLKLLHTFHHFQRFTLFLNQQVHHKQIVPQQQFLFLLLYGEKLALHVLY